MPRKRSTTPKGQLSLWGELTAPADALAGAPGLAEPKRRPASAPVAGKVEPLPAQTSSPTPTPARALEPGPVLTLPRRREWTVSEALRQLGETPSHRASELPQGLELRWPLRAGMPCPRGGAGPVGRRRYQHRGLDVVHCGPCGNDGMTLSPAAAALLTALDEMLDGGAGLC